MPDLPKWAADTLAQMPTVVAVLVTLAGTIKWMERWAERRIAEQKQHAAERTALIQRHHNAQIRAKNKRIRELERALGNKSRGP